MADADTPELPLAACLDQHGIFDQLLLYLQWLMSSVADTKLL